MTDSDEPTGADEPTRISEPTSSDRPSRVARSRDTDVPGSAASTTPGRRVDGTIDPPDQPIWARRPVIIGAVAAVVVVALLAFFLLTGDGDTEDAGTDDRDSTSQSTTTLDPLDPTSETTAPPDPATTAPTTAPAADPEGTPGTPTTAVGAVICQAFNRLEEGVEPVYNAGDVSDDEMLARADRLADSIDTSVGLFGSLEDRPYAADAKAYATYLEPLAKRFRDATTRDEIDALGTELLEPEIDIAEAASRLQDEWDAECG